MPQAPVVKINNEDQKTTKHDKNFLIQLRKTSS